MWTALLKPEITGKYSEINNLLKKKPKNNLLKAERQAMWGPDFYI